MYQHDESFTLYIQPCISKNKQITFEDYLRDNKEYDMTNYTSTFDLKKRKVFCNDFGSRDIEIDQWEISGVDISEAIKTKRRDIVALVENHKPIDETDYLLLSCVLEVPLEIYSFSLDIDPKVFSRLRRTVCCLPLLEFDDDSLLKFLKIKKLLLHELRIDGLRKKNDDVVALASVTRRLAERKSWATVFTEESFIDQYLLPFVECILLADKDLFILRSSGHIPLSGTEQSNSSSGIDSRQKMTPTFLLMTTIRESSVGFLAIEVKKEENFKSSQVLSDRSKLGLECKRMVDEQVLEGSESPRSFGVLVCGFECRVFSCFLGDMGAYVFVEE
ncbi:hypothetical protein EDC96DRAFT_567714 [Choanephora cucurbitarum]|nr:hypothetical protein EDC96DRAFT_567714 [Choanephora cucurbitarum]